MSAKCQAMHVTTTKRKVKHRTATRTPSSGCFASSGSTSSSPLGRALDRREAQGQPQTDDRGPAPAQLPDAAHRSRDPDAQPLHAAASSPGARVHDALAPHAAAATRARTAPALVRSV